MDEEPIIRVAGLRIRYGRTEAVRNLDLRVARGEVVGLIGPDGAGKTSTLRAIGGLQRPTAGTVEVRGHSAWSHRRALHRSLGTLAQRFALYGDLSVDENIQFFALLYGVPNMARPARRPAPSRRTGGVPRAPRRQALRRHEAEAGARLQPDARPRNQTAIQEFRQE